MTIAFLLQDTGAIYGAQRATLDLIGGLVASGRIQVGVWLLEETRLGLAQSSYREALRATGATLIRFPVAGAFSPGCICRLRDTLRKTGVSLLHSVGPKADLFAWLATRGLSTRWVSTVHGWLCRRDWKERLHESVNRFCIRRSHRVICLSSYYEQRLLACGIRRDQLALIPSGFVPGELDDLPASDSRPFAAGWMGRLSEEKEPGLFLDAIVRLPTGKFLLAGDGPLRPTVAARLREPALAGRVTHSGYLPRAEFFRSVAALVITSRTENLPYTILEAMASRLPVVAMRVGGIPDLVVPGETGLLVSPGDTAALAEAIALLQGDPRRAARLGAAGRKRMEEHFSLPTAVRAHENLYLASGMAR